MKKILSNNLFKQAFLGMAVVLALYCTFGLSTFAYHKEIFKPAHIIMCLVSSFLYYMFDSISYKIKDNYEQIYKLNLIMAIVLQIYMLFGFIDVILNGFEYVFISKVIFALILTLVAVKRRECFRLPHVDLRTYIGLILVILISVILMYNPYIFSVKWDGLLYYDTFGNSDFFRISSLCYYRHISQGAGIPIAYILDITFGNTGLTIYLINLFTMIFGALAFWGIIRQLVPERSIVLYTILTAMYIWSPWVLGLSGYASIDYFCANWFMVVLYFTISKQFFLQSVTGLLYAMVKEPAIIIYGCLCIGVLAVDLYENKRIKFSYLRYYGMITVAIVWLITLMFMGMWSYPGSEVKVEISHIVTQVGILYIFNFSWLVWGLIIIGLGVILIFRRKDKNLDFSVRTLVPMLFSLIAFTLFNFIFVTVPNTRYTDIIPLCGYIIISVELLILSKKVKNLFVCMFSAGLTAIMLISSYISIDPISKMIFYDEKIEDTLIYTTVVDRHMYGDGIVYNKQALNMESSISAAINDSINYDRDIVIYGIYPNVYFFDGMTELKSVKKGEFRWIEEYFDFDNQIRNHLQNEETIPFMVGLASDVESIIKNVEIGKVYTYLYFKGIGDELVEDIAKKFHIVEEVEYDRCGWKLKGIVFTIGE